MVLKLAAAFMLCALSAGPAMALEVGDTAPCVTLETIAANSNSSAELCAGARSESQRFTLLEFFSVTCSYCQANLPIVSQLGSAIAPTTQLRFVSIDRRRQDVTAYIAANAEMALYPVALDLTRAAKQAFDVNAVPTVFVLDQNEKVVFKHVGVLSSGDVAAIRSLVR